MEDSTFSSPFLVAVELLGDDHSQLSMLVEEVGVSSWLLIEFQVMSDWRMSLIMATAALLRPGQASRPLQMKQLLSVVISQLPCHCDFVVVLAYCWKVGQWGCSFSCVPRHHQAPVSLQPC